jgi:hypothetical protein
LRLLLLASGALPAASADNPLLLMLSGDEQLVSLATGSPRPVSKAPSTTTVITAEDIKATGAGWRILEVPDLHVSRGFLSALIADSRHLHAIQSGSVGHDQRHSDHERLYGNRGRRSAVSYRPCSARSDTGPGFGAARRGADPL